MFRRSFLSVICLLGAGCLQTKDREGGSQSPTATSSPQTEVKTHTESNTQTSPQTENTETVTDYECTPRSVSVLEAKSPTEDIAVQATLQRDAVTEDHTAKLVVKFTNQSDNSQEIPFSVESPGPWRSEDYDLYLLPLSSDQQQSAEGCWTAGSEDNPISGSGSADYTTIPPNKTRETEYQLWDYAREEGYFKPGTYRFVNNEYVVRLEIQK